MFLHDCVSQDPAEAELLLACSSAAYEAAKIDRDRMTQALLRVGPRSASSEDSINSPDDDPAPLLIAALGVGVQLGDSSFSEGKDSKLFDITKLRSNRVILISEQGEQGQKVNGEILFYFFNFLYPLIQGGNVFVPETPLEPGFTHGEFVKSILNPETRRLRTVAPTDIIATRSQGHLSAKETASCEGDVTRLVSWSIETASPYASVTTFAGNSGPEGMLLLDFEGFPKHVECSATRTVRPDKDIPEAGDESECLRLKISGEGSTLEVLRQYVLKIKEVNLHSSGVAITIGGDDGEWIQHGRYLHLKLRDGRLQKLFIRLEK